MSCLQYCFALCKINLFIKPFIGFFWLGIVEGQYFLAVIIRKIRLVVSYFGEVEMSKEVSFLDRHVEFPYRELRRSHITLYKDCDSILLSLDFLSKQ
jgi:hypothetical protein